MAKSSKLLSGLLTLSFLAYAADPPDFSTGVTLVHIDAQVLNPDGSLVPRLGQSDFRVFEDGKEQQLVAFAAEEQPLDLVLLVDISGSMMRAVEDFALAGQTALNQMHQGDRVAVMTLNTKTAVVAALTDDLAIVRDAVRRLPKAVRSGTHLHDGVYDAATLLRGADDKSRRRRAVLIFTDNMGGGGQHRAAAATENLWEADATLSGMITRRKGPPGAVTPPGFDLLFGARGIDREVEMTGGEMIKAARVEQTLPEMLRRVRNRYSVYYKQPEGKTDAVRDIRVELAEGAKSRFPGARVLARQGYRVRGPDQNGFGQR